MTTLHGGVLVTNRPDPTNVLRLDMGCLPMLSAMETSGMRVSREAITTLDTNVVLEMEELHAKVESLTGYKTSNLGSGDQVAELLFAKMGLKQAGREKFTKSRTRLSVDQDVLVSMVSQHAAIQPLIDWKIREKIRAGYTYALLRRADENDRIHCSLNHTGQETGRITSSEPNLTTIPTRTKIGQLVRCAFIPSDGNVMGSIDMSMIEPRAVAHDSNCASMIEVFTSNLDLYWRVASLVYKRDFTEDQKKHGIEETTGLTYKEFYRQNSKTLVLGLLYSISPEGLVDQFLASGAVPFLTGGERVWDYDRHYKGAVERCTQAMNNFFEGFPEILVRRREHHRRAMRFGCCWCMFGRVRWIPQVRSCHQYVVGEGLRNAGNHPIQAAAAGVLKLWLAKIWSRMGYWMKHGVIPLQPIHDEALVEGPQSVLDDFLPECATALKELLPPSVFDVPLKTAYATAASWGAISK